VANSALGCMRNFVVRRGVNFHLLEIFKFIQKLFWKEDFCKALPLL
jgi:hypothetical protein